MASGAPFKKCSSCGNKVPTSDGHSRCLTCLGEAHDVRACVFCQAFTKQALRRRQDRLRVALWEGALRPPMDATRSTDPLEGALPPPREPSKKSKKDSKRDPSQPEKSSKHKSSKPAKAAASQGSKAPSGSEKSVPRASATATVSPSVPRSDSTSVSRSEAHKRKAAPDPSAQAQSSQQEDSGDIILLMDAPPSPMLSETSSQRDLPSSQPRVSPSRALIREEHRLPAHWTSQVAYTQDWVPPVHHQYHGHALDEHTDPQREMLLAPPGRCCAHDNPAALPPRSLGYTEQASLGHRPRERLRDHRSVQGSTLTYQAVHAPDEPPRRATKRPASATVSVPPPDPKLPRRPSPPSYRDLSTPVLPRAHVRPSDSAPPMGPTGSQLAPDRRTQSDPGRPLLDLPQLSPPQFSDSDSTDSDGSSGPILPLDPDDQESRPTSPPPDLRPYSDLVIRMARSLELEAQLPQPATSDKHYDAIDKTASGSAQLAMMPCLASVAKALWEKPASLPSTSRAVEALYKIYDPEVNFLTKHPAPNSVVVQATLSRPKGRQPTAPAHKDGRRLDQMGKRIYNTASLALRVANYQGAMGAYSRQLAAQLQPFLDRLPDDCRAQANKLHQESLAVATQQMRAARHATDCAARQVSSAVVLRRQAWLRSTGLAEDARAKIEDLSFDGVGLFNTETDNVMDDLQKKRYAAKRLNTSSQPQRHQRPPYRRPAPYQAPAPTFDRPRYTPPHPSPTYPGRNPRPKFRQPQGAKRQDRKPKQY